MSACPHLSVVYSVGRTRRSAPTQTTSTRQVQPSDAVTPISVGADLCVRLSSPERSLFCGRTRRSAPTQTTSTRKVQPSDSVTPVFVETHEPCVPTKDYTSLFDTTDALLLSERSYTFCATATWKNPNLHVAIFHSPRGDVLIPPKFHLIPPKFYFSSTWRIFFFHVEI